MHPGRANAWISAMSPGISLLRPIELLVHAAGGGSPVLSRSQVWQIDGYLDEIAARPTGARLTSVRL